MTYSSTLRISYGRHRKDIFTHWSKYARRHWPINGRYIYLNHRPDLAVHHSFCLCRIAERSEIARNSLPTNGSDWPFPQTERLVATTDSHSPSTAYLPRPLRFIRKVAGLFGRSIYVRQHDYRKERQPGCSKGRHATLQNKNTLNEAQGRANMRLETVVVLLHRCKYSSGYQLQDISVLSTHYAFARNSNSYQLEEDH